MNTTATRGPGRPRKEATARRRRKGSTETTGGRLGVNPDKLDFDTYRYRWFSDKPGRLETKTRNDDWDLIPDSGEKEDNTDLGSMLSVVDDIHPDGSPRRAYLCRKLKTFYDEDKADEQAELDRQLAELRRGRDRSGSSQSDYVPHSGINIGE